MSENPVQILLVEDSPGDVELVREGLLDSKVYNELHVVGDGVEAIRFLNKEGQYSEKPSPDLILLDINLPKKDGHEVLADIKANPEFRKIPVVMLTTSNYRKDVESAYSQHVNAYVTKPLDGAEFLAAIAKIEDFWLSLAKLPYRSLE